MYIIDRFGNHIAQISDTERKPTTAAAATSSSSKDKINAQKVKIRGALDMDVDKRKKNKKHNTTTGSKAHGGYHHQSMTFPMDVDDNEGREEEKTEVVFKKFSKLSVSDNNDAEDEDVDVVGGSCSSKSSLSLADPNSKVVEAGHISSPLPKRPSPQRHRMISRKQAEFILEMARIRSTLQSNSSA